MPIAVLCPNCKSRFSVSDKFAGKQGPCPKCKTVITVPETAAEEVKVHVPEAFATGGKDSKGRAISKPIAREETRLSMVTVAIAVVGTIGVLILAFATRQLEGNPALMMRAITLLLISPPIIVAGYSFLREPELEPHRGLSLWLRAAVCGVLFSLIWAAVVFGIIQNDLAEEMYAWFFIAPVAVAIGGGIALACMELDFTNGTLLYSFYVLVTMVVAKANGMPWIWNVTGT